MKKSTIIEIYANDHMYGMLTEKQIKAAFPEGHEESVERDWEAACEYLVQFIDEEGVCVLELDTVLDGDVTDYSKTMAIFMIFTALMKNGEMKKLPPLVSMKAFPYINARMSLSAADAAKHKMLDEFVIKANHELISVKDSTVSADDVFERIFSDIPSVESFASVGETDRKRYIPFFEMMEEKARACADSSYAEKIRLYTDAITKQK